ncbi:MAG: hypothetical protein ACSHXY_01305 [Alphaproteobacteria bacterium]
MTKRIDQLEQFCRLIRSRTEENRKAVNVLLDAKLYSVAFGILRQEIDSLIRIAYLENARQNYSPARARILIRDLVEGNRWTRTTKKGKQANITDREMLNAYRAAIGWEKIVYDFGCELIHLSKFHDYQNSDPVSNLSEDSKIEITNYLKQYHAFDGNNLTFDTLVQYLPDVIDKVCDNTLAITTSFENKLRNKIT